MGRIWVEDQDFHIVRFNGAYNGSSQTNFYFHFDSWRVIAGHATSGCRRSSTAKRAMSSTPSRKKLMFKAQTRLWGYNLGRAQAGAGVEQDSGGSADAGEGSDAKRQRLFAAAGAARLGPPGRRQRHRPHGAAGSARARRAKSTKCSRRWSTIWKSPTI